MLNQWDLPANETIRRAPPHSRPSMAAPFWGPIWPCLTTSGQLAPWLSSRFRSASNPAWTAGSTAPSWLGCRRPLAVKRTIPAAVVEVPALSNRWRPVRRFIDGGMTRGIGDPGVLARTIKV